MKSLDNKNKALASDDWIAFGWGSVGGARLTHAWRYHPRNGLLQSACRAVLRYGNPLELLNVSSQPQCKICALKWAKNAQHEVPHENPN